jgi:hypothetical protein
MFRTKLYRGRVFSIFVLAVIVLMISCSKDKNPVKSDDNQSAQVHVTDNVKIKPTYLILDGLKQATAFDVIFENEPRELSVVLNSGPYGSAGVTGKNLDVVDFNEEVDIESGLAIDSEESQIVGVWYNYDITTHTVTSKNEIYLIAAADYNKYKLRIDSFSGSTYGISYSPVDENGKPTNTKTAQISASEGSPAYFVFSSGTVSAPENWDVAFVTFPLFIAELNAYIQNPGMRVNSVAGAEIAYVDETDYDALTSVPSGLTYKQDYGDSLAVGDDVLIYNSQNHRLTVHENRVYIVKTTDGKYAKLQVLSYYNPDTGESGYFNYKAAILK